MVPPQSPRTTSVTARLRLRAGAPVECALQVAVAHRPGVEVLSEELRLVHDGTDLPVTEHEDAGGGRMHAFTAATGETLVDYRARVRTDPAAVAGCTVAERWEFTRPSRYCEADKLSAVASAAFAGVGPADLPGAVSAWVHERLDYVAGSSGPTDGAVDTLLAGRGVCRDHAHLAVALLRALDVPARVVAVYAPGLAPMDFHAVVEAAVAGRWRLHDPTGLAPREALVRIRSGRDAADTAFLTSAGATSLEEMEVTAVLEGDLPREDPSRVVALP
ncbi:transglutaminase family protein [Kineococcus sp. NUM-3379]